MRCRSCGQTASINMPQHRLALCKTHFLDWFCERTGQTIRKYKMLEDGQKVLVAVSGGKDSLALWDVLNRLGYAADGLYVDLGIESDIHYSARSLEYASRFALENHLHLHVVATRELYGKDITGFIQRGKHGQERPCSVCGLIKRRIFNTFPRERGYPVLATGHNLDDEAAVLFSNTLNWDLELLSRQGPVLPGSAYFTSRIKPFCRFYERETAAYTLMRGIEYIEEECPFAGGSRTNFVKTLLNQLEIEQPGAKLAFYSQFIKQRQAGFLPSMEGQPVEMTLCPECGEPTTSAGKCAFCKLIDHTN